MSAFDRLAGEPLARAASEGAASRDEVRRSARIGGIVDTIDDRTRAILERRRLSQNALRRRGLVRRALAVSDALALTAAFCLTAALSSVALSERLGGLPIGFLFLATLPLWLVAASAYGLYERDERRTDHSTVDELVGVFHLLVVGTWAFYVVAALTNLASPTVETIMTFSAFAFALVAVGRIAARTVYRRRLAFLQNTVIVGAGEVGQLVARKFLHHPEYGINVVGFVDGRPKERGKHLGHLTILGTPEDLPRLVTLLDVERLVVAFSNDPDHETMEVVRSLHEYGLHVDIVPRLFDVMGPRAGMHSVEGLSLVGLPAARLAGPGRIAKRGLDIAGASLLLALTSPLFAYAAWRIWRESGAPVFFRQQRLGRDMREFMCLKFRTMYQGVDQTVHRNYIRSTMNAAVAPTANGLYKQDRSADVTPSGRWLRRTSLDELPQLINVLRGEMSLVGPRPCLRYETEHFAPHHFERFQAAPGLTGLWQVTARGRSTFGEALEMDVAYVRGWSLGLDLRLLCRTPLELLRPNGTA